jgi:putative ABC transport system ATP-binding protein
MNSPEPLIELKSVSKVYGTATTFEALRCVTLSIGKGEFISIVGPSGSGKSTLLHILGCLDKPTSGELFIGHLKVSKMGEDELAEIRNSQLGFVFQAFNLSPTINVFKNVGLPLMIKGMEDDEIEKRVDELLKVVGLSDKKFNKPSQLSGGEKQRVAIARALANNPQILFADEPTGNLDSKSGKDVMDFLSGLWKKGVTVIVVTHEPVVAAYSERVIHIRDGKVEKDVKQKPKIPNVNIKIKRDYA